MKTLVLKKLLFGLSLFFIGAQTIAQNGLESVIVEKYYLSDANDEAASIGTLPTGLLPIGFMSICFPAINSRWLMATQITRLSLIQQHRFLIMKTGGVQALLIQKRKRSTTL